MGGDFSIEYTSSMLSLRLAQMVEGPSFDFVCEQNLIEKYVFDNEKIPFANIVLLIHFRMSFR